MNWISVEDRLPEELRLILVCHSTNHTDIDTDNWRLKPCFEEAVLIGDRFSSALYYHTNFFYMMNTN